MGKLRTLGMGLSGLILCGFVAGVAPATARAAEAPAPATSVPPSVTPPPASDEKVPEDVSHKQLRYAEREAKNPQSARFKAGDGAGVYISGSAVAIVLLVVLLVVLL